MKILFLSQRVPYPPNRGDKISSWRMVERMSRRHSVRVIAFAHDQEDLDGAEELRKKGFEVMVFRTRPLWDRARSLPLLFTKKPLTLGVFGSKALQAEVDRQAPEVDLLYAFSSSMGAFLLPHSDKPRIMHFAELDSDKWRQYAEFKGLAGGMVYRREHRTLFAFERELAHAVDNSVFCTPLEQRIFQERIPGVPSVVIRNGVDLEKYRPDPDAAEPGHLVFVGVMNYYPNEEGCVWFAQDILPRIRERFPETRFSIVGAHPTGSIKRLGELPGVTVTGFVDDPADWLRRAAVSVAPLRIARGIQNKVLEAMAMGLPLVGTTSATQGVDGEDERDYLVADDVESQVAAVCRLLGNPREARELGRRARAFVEENYDWDRCLDPLDGILEPFEKAISP